MPGNRLPYPTGGYLTTRQAAHAAGITEQQLHYLRRLGDATPAFQYPGSHGVFLWTIDEVKRVRDLAGRKAWRRRRKTAMRGKHLDGLLPVAPIVPRGKRRPPEVK